MTLFLRLKIYISINSTIILYGHHGNNNKKIQHNSIRWNVELNS